MGWITLGLGITDRRWEGLPVQTQTMQARAAAENGFYDFEIDGVTHSLETTLGTLESQAAEKIKSLRTNEGTTHISPQDKYLVAVFAAMQLLRRRSEQSRSLALNQTLREAILKVAAIPPSQPLRVTGISLNTKK